MLNWWQRIAALFLTYAVVQLLLASGAVAMPYTAEEMLSDCQALLGTAKTASDPDAIELENSFATGACWGAFLGIQQVATMKLEGAQNPVFQACVHEDTTLIQLIRLFDGYARAHPERDAEPFTIVALAALHDTFPCSGGKGRKR